MSRNKVLLIAWSAMTSIYILQFVILEQFQPEKYDLKDTMVFPSVSFVVGLLLLFLLVIPVYNSLKDQSLFLKTLGFIATGIAYSFLYIMLVFAIYLPTYSESFAQFYWREVREYIIFDFHNVMKNYVSLLAILFAYDYLQSSAKAIVQQKNLENELNSTRLDILKSQLQPHFLFNALNSVVAIIEENTIKAQQMLITLSDLLRSSLRTDFTKMIPFDLEIKTLQEYLAIEQARYEEQLQVEFDLETGAMSTLVPPFILQPLVENAIKHGYKQQNQHLFIKIIAQKPENQAILMIKNNGAPLASSLKMGKGLATVKERLQLHYGPQALFEMYEENNWVIHKISIYAADKNPGR